MEIDFLKERYLPPKVNNFSEKNIVTAFFRLPNEIEIIKTSIRRYS